MNQKLISNLRVFGVVFIGVLMSLVIVSAIATAAIPNEEEPNDTPGTANRITTEEISGTINPVGDVDYFELPGVNTQWGYIAMLDTIASGSSADGTLTAYAADGAAVIQQDSGSWSDGSVIAWQHFVDGSDYHYLKVSETGDDGTITPYLLRYYKIAISEMDEVEPNETPETGTISAKSMTGNLASGSDVDCFRFDGNDGEQFLFALNADPENDGSSTDFELAVYGPSGALITSVDVGGTGNNEVIDDIILAESGIHAYCVSSAVVTVDPNDEYLVGPLRNHRGYLPYFQVHPVWLDPGPNGVAALGDTLTFQLNFTNTTRITIPERLWMYGNIDDDCLRIVDAPGAYYTSTEEVRWEMFDLGPGVNFSKTFETQAIAGCESKMHEGVVMDYFVLGVGKDLKYAIQPGLYLPIILGLPNP
ncbi:MAG: hypothetical protein U9R58_03905 [Chloroflexota bacterium]|nr:hypothetical protein [Chloroflexota bacterium]